MIATLPKPSKSTREKLRAPFPYFGGKSRIAAKVWDRFGEVDNYVEPFFGSGAMLWAAPRVHRTETVNDADGLVANFWRAVAADPEAVAAYADWPVNENDLHARHCWLVERKDTLQAKLDGDPDFHDAKVAGWWCWGVCCWIGSGFCSGKGPWRSVRVADGSRQLVHLGSAGQGVNRQLVHLGSAGQGVNRQLVHLGDAGRGVNRKRVAISIRDWMQALADRLRYVRICCGDWTRVTGPTVTVKQGLTAVFLDPPYHARAKRTADLYRVDDLGVAGAVRDWALANGDNPKMRIALCGYEGEHRMPKSWECLAWKTAGGFASQGARRDVNRHRERIWFSPHCLSGNGGAG